MRIVGLPGDRKKDRLERIGPATRGVLVKLLQRRDRLVHRATVANRAIAKDRNTVLRRWSLRGLNDDLGVLRVARAVGDRIVRRDELFALSEPQRLVDAHRGAVRPSSKPQGIVLEVRAVQVGRRDERRVVLDVVLIGPGVPARRDGVQIVHAFAGFEVTTNDLDDGRRHGRILLREDRTLHEQCARDTGTEEREDLVHREFLSSC